MRVYTHTALAKKDTRCGKNTRRQQDSPRIHRLFARTHTHTLPRLHLLVTFSYSIVNSIDALYVWSLE